MNNIKIKLKTSELTGAALDWAVAKCELGEAINEVDDPHFYSTDWALAGPIIEREGITICTEGEGESWSAYFRENLFDDEYEHEYQHGPTPLIAAMRCYVASQLGDEVEVPEELMGVTA
jgi:hypothetical protein